MLAAAPADVAADVVVVVAVVVELAVVVVVVVAALLFGVAGAAPLVAMPAVVAGNTNGNSRISPCSSNTANTLFEIDK